MTAIGAILGALFSPLQASVSPATITTIGTGTNVPSATAFVTAKGGAGTYTYLWSLNAGDNTISIHTPTAASTYFTTTLNNFSDKTADFQCVITDGSGASVTVYVSVEMKGPSAP